jgi:hypothetical protein
MADYTAFVDLANRFFSIAVITTEAMGWMAVIFGTIGYFFTKTKPAKKRRYKGLVIGGAAALICVLFIGNIYEAVTWIMTDQTGSVDATKALYPESFIEIVNPNGPVAKILNTAGVLGQVSAIIGMASFTFGAGLRALAKSTSIYRGKSSRLLYAGIALMFASMMERIMGAAVYVIYG